MLVLSRKLNETIVIDGNIRLKVLAIRGNCVRLGIEAPEQVAVLRAELLDEARPGASGSAPGVRPALSRLPAGAASPVPASPALPCGQGAGDRGVPR